jgi:predicted transposase/invertase (TIGR01784 family)
VAKLKYKFTHDVLSKMLFVKCPDLLKRLVAAVLKVAADDISEFVITNPEIPPDELGKKFCRLDINMIVDKIKVDLEVQVETKGRYFPERIMYYWAREFSSTLPEGDDYSKLPRVVFIGILDESLYSCEDYHSEFRTLEVTRHDPLTDRMAIHCFEVRKIPEDPDVKNELEMILSLFRASTEKDLSKLEEKGVSIVSQAIETYREITASNELKEIERLRFKASHDEATALEAARQKEREKLQRVLAKKDAELERLRSRARHDEATALEAARQKEREILQSVLAEKDAALADKDAEIARLRALLGERE